MSPIADILLTVLRPASFLTVPAMQRELAALVPGTTAREALDALLELERAKMVTSLDGGLSFCR
jgi:hypothetical protein